MAGAMRKMAVYLGLVEDETDLYDDYAYDEDETTRPDVRPEPRATRGPCSRSVTTGPRREAEAPVRSPSAARRPASSPTWTPTGSPRCTRATTTTRAPSGEYFREGTPVIMNLTDMEDADAKRLVDFAAGLVFAVHGTIERVTAKVFLLSPANVVVTAEEKARLAEGGFFNQS